MGLLPLCRLISIRCRFSFLILI